MALQRRYFTTQGQSAVQDESTNQLVHTATTPENHSRQKVHTTMPPPPTLMFP